MCHKDTGKRGENMKKLNLEIEAHLAVYRYALRKGVPLAGGIFDIMMLLSYTLDDKYNITDTDSYNEFYQRAINAFKEIDFYKNFQESPSARNMNTNKNLTKTCE